MLTRHNGLTTGQQQWLADRHAGAVAATATVAVAAAVAIDVGAAAGHIDPNLIQCNRIAVRDIERRTQVLDSGDCAGKAVESLDRCAPTGNPGVGINKPR